MTIFRQTGRDSPLLRNWALTRIVSIPNSGATLAITIVAARPIRVQIVHISIYPLRLDLVTKAAVNSLGSSGQGRARVSEVAIPGNKPSILRVGDGNARHLTGEEEDGDD
jgi:hypothetical protein